MRYTTLAVVLLTVPALSMAQATDAPRTSWGQPDLQGIWDFRTITPLERPEVLGDRAFLTAEEAAALEGDVVDRNLRLLNRGAERTSTGGQRRPPG